MLVRSGKNIGSYSKQLEFIWTCGRFSKKMVKIGVEWCWSIPYWCIQHWDVSIVASIPQLDGCWEEHQPIVSTKIVIIPVWWMIVSHTRLAHWLKILDPKKQQNQHGLIIRIQIATVHNVAKFIGQLLPSSAIMTTEHAKAGAFNGTTDTCDVSGSINMCVYIYILYILHNHFLPNGSKQKPGFYSPN